MATTEQSLADFSKGFVGHYGATPTWLTDLITMITDMLSSCPIPLGVASLDTMIANEPLRVGVMGRIACRRAGVPIMERSKATQACIDTWKGLAAPDKTVIVAFAVSMAS